jgi:hypothetical protein
MIAFESCEDFVPLDDAASAVPIIVEEEARSAMYFCSFFTLSRFVMCAQDDDVIRSDSSRKRPKRAVADISTVKD